MYVRGYLQSSENGRLVTIEHLAFQSFDYEPYLINDIPLNSIFMFLLVSLYLQGHQQLNNQCFGTDMGF
jgi:hypothetical protein